MSIGNKIHQRRKELGLTQAELGRRVHKSSQVISNWERGYTTGIAVEDLERTTDDTADTEDRGNVLTDHDVAVEGRGVEAKVLGRDDTATDTDEHIVPLVGSLGVCGEHAGRKSDRQGESFEFHIFNLLISLNY